MNYPPCLIRIMSDIIDFNNSKYVNIFIQPDKNNIKNIKALIIGPKQTPYEYGFFFFDIIMPNDYPKTSPTVKFDTIDGIVRFNPNLYKNGKVCLSILGTWSGPGWLPSMTLSSVLLSIQSLLSEQPITNEPGYESVLVTDPNSINYNHYITYHTYRLAIKDVLLNKFVKYEYFQSIIKQYFIKNKNFIIDNLKSYQTIVKKKELKINIYFLKKYESIDFNKLLQQFIKINI